MKIFKPCERYTFSFDLMAKSVTPLANLLYMHADNENVEIYFDTALERYRGRVHVPNINGDTRTLEVSPGWCTIDETEFSLPDTDFVVLNRFEDSLKYELNEKAYVTWCELTNTHVNPSVIGFIVNADKPINTENKHRATSTSGSITCTVPPQWCVEHEEVVLCPSCGSDDLEFAGCDTHVCVYCGDIVFKEDK